MQLTAGTHGNLGVEGCPAGKLGFPAQAFCSSPGTPVSLPPYPDMEHQGVAFFWPPPPHPRYSLSTRAPFLLTVLHSLLWLISHSWLSFLKGLGFLTSVLCLEMTILLHLRTPGQVFLSLRVLTSPCPFVVSVPRNWSW